MIAWPVALALGLLLTLFGVIILSFAVCIEVLLAIRLVCAIWHWKEVATTLVTVAIGGTFAYMFGRGAYLMTSEVVDGMIGRFL